MKKLLIAMLLPMMMWATDVFSQSSINQISKRQIELSSVPVSTNLGVGGVFGPIVCDSDGAIYLRTIDGPVNAIETPIQKLDAQGHVKTFRGSSIPDLRGTPYIFTFAVGTGGRIFEIVGASEDPVRYIAALAEDGTYAWLRKVDLPMPLVDLFIPLTSGEFLIAGINKRDGNAGEEFSGIYDANGRLVRKLTFYKQENKGKNENVNSQRPMPTGSRGIFPGDGKMYFLTNSDPPELIVATTLGEILRSFPLKAPFDNAEAEDLFIGRPGSIHVVHHSKEPKLIDGKKVSQVALTSYDLETGLPTATYTDLPQKMLVCVQGTDVTFLGIGRDGKFEMTHGELK